MQVKALRNVKQEGSARGSILDDERLDIVRLHWTNLSDAIKWSIVEIATACSANLIHDNDSCGDLRTNHYQVERS